MFGIIIALIVGVFIGYILNGVLSSNTTEEKLQEAYEKGKVDEKERILAEVQAKYGVAEKCSTTDICDEPKEV